MTVFIKPTIRDNPTSLPAPNLSRITFTAPELLPVLNIEHPDVDFEVDRNSGAGMTAPTLKGSGLTDMTPYIKQAALLPGEGATVVLRVEVLETGEPGRIEIDTSSGSRQVDQAVVNYARTQRWYPGRTSGSAHAMWIRWGVRLQA